ncbi:MAG: ATP-grasp domain-containing protein [Shinella sp.]|nr:ATP-grasp domain-containing protein [Shinella sp.]
MRATSQNSPAILIAAVSGRSLAAAARRAGYRPLVADLFNDSDTVALSERVARFSGSIGDGIDKESATETLLLLTEHEKPEALVYGSGFERRPEILKAFERHFPLAGNTAKTVAMVKDPVLLAQLCRQSGIPHPEVRLDAPTRSAGWLRKIGGGAGGAHVHHASHPRRQDGCYFQKFVPGRSISVLFLAQMEQAHIVGFSRQWSAPSAQSPFRYGGAVRLTRFDRKKRMQVRMWLDALTAATGLVGLCSADFIDGPDGLHLIEINPRPGATLDIFDSDDAPLLTQHLNAVRGEAITVPTYRGAAASAIAYAVRPIRNFPPVEWPELTADHQKPGSALQADDPVCTVLARAHSAAAAERAVKSRTLAMAAYWKGEFR